MNQEKQVRIALIGTGSMGTEHLKSIEKLPQARLTAVCDTNRELADRRAQEYGVPAYYSAEELLANAELDAVLIATPHYDHTTIALQAFAMEKPVHVLTEKPVGVHANDVKKMISAYEEAKKRRPDLKFAAMFQQRTLGHWRKIKDLIDSGELGKLIRTTWIITDWFRTQIYYDNGGWRGTWEGEGGGVLLNQCPHNLDLFQWLVGMPDRITGFAGIGKHHHIEVEDEVTGVFEYDNGMTGHFITTTAESPGTNRLEIIGEKGKLIFEDDKLTFHRNRRSMLEFLQDSPERFGKVENWKCDIPFEDHGESGHRLIIENFCQSLLEGEDLIAQAPEGLNSVSMGNAIMLSNCRDNTPVTIPLDGDAYEMWLKEQIEQSDFVKNEAVGSSADDNFGSSF